MVVRRLRGPALMLDGGAVWGTAGDLNEGSNRSRLNALSTRPTLSRSWGRVEPHNPWFQYRLVHGLPQRI